jgi:hypothetical protein
MARSRRGWLRSIVGFALGMLTAAILFEAYLRIVEATPLWRVLPAAEVSLYGPDSDTGYALRPNVEGLWLTENRTRIRISAQGLRDHDTSFAKPPGTFRIAIAGDSITEALQVDLDATFSGLLEKKYRVAGTPVETINLGLSGASPAVLITRMTSLGSRFDPDLMLFIVNANDLVAPIMMDDSRFPAYVLSEDRRYLLGYRFRDQQSYVFRTSRLGQAVYWLLDNSRLLRVVNARRNQGLGGASGWTNSSVAGCAVDAPSLAKNLREDGDKGRLIAAFVGDIHAKSSSQGATAVIAVRGLLHHPCLSQHALGEKLRNLLIEKLAGTGVGLIDLDKEIELVLARSGDSRSVRDLYGFGARIGEGHLNELGHDIYADALMTGLSPWIKER